MLLIQIMLPKAKKYLMLRMNITQLSLKGFVTLFRAVDFIWMDEMTMYVCLICEFIIHSFFLGQDEEFRPPCYQGCGSNRLL